jgi:predicted nucleotidyltransferase
VWLFGSRARGENRPDSDWDVLAVVRDDARFDVDDPVLAWRIARDSGVPSTLLVTRKSDLENIWGQVNTLGYDLAREGLRIDVG